MDKESCRVVGTRCTGGERLADGSEIVLLRGEKSPTIELMLWAGDCLSRGLTVENGGSVYRPIELDDSLAREVVFPRVPLAFGSPEKLHAGIAGVFEQKCEMSAAQSTLLAAFVIATWFIDYLPSAPCVSIAAPDIDDAVLTLRVLRCLCYRPILLGEVSPSALQTLPSGLSATLLIRQTEMSAAVSNILNVAGHRGVPMLINGRLVQLYCSRVVADSEHCPYLENALRISLSPRAGQPSVRFTDEEAEELTQRFQGQLLRYRLEHAAHVAHSTFDAPHFTWGTRQLVRMLGRPLASGALQERVVSMLARRDEETRAEQAVDCRSAVVEVLLACCHDPSLSRLYIAEVAEGVNVLLHERFEDVTVGARRVGALLKELGLYTERIDKSGRGLELRESTRHRIHRLAVQYDIGTADGADLCRHCGDQETHP